MRYISSQKQKQANYIWTSVFKMYMIPPEASMSLLIYSIHTIDNYFSITHLFDVCIASFPFFLCVKECRLAIFFPFDKLTSLMCMFRLNDLSNGSFKQVYLNFKSSAVSFFFVSLTDSWLMFTLYDLRFVFDLIETLT
jgi:hypothetical protein